MKIRHISVSTLSVLHQYGGAIQRRILEIAQIQSKMGHDVVIFSVGDQDKSIVQGNVQIIQKQCHFPLPFKHFEFLYKVVHDTYALDADILHFHSQPEGAFVSKHIKARKYLSFDYFQFRGGHKTPFYKVYQKFLKQFDLLLPVSEYCLEGAGNYWNIDRSKFQVVYNGVNSVQFHPDLELRRSKRELWMVDKTVLLYVGRVCKQKGTDVLLNAMKVLNKRRHDIQLVIAGPIAEFGNTQDPDNWSGRIQAVGGLYLGAVEESEIAAIYNAADIFVMPTRELEMFGMAALEAQACGKPVVASDHGGLKEVVPKGSGLLFSVGKSNQLAEKIEMLVDNPVLYDESAKNALENAYKFDWHLICNHLDSLYQRTYHSIRHN